MQFCGSIEILFVNSSDDFGFICFAGSEFFASISTSRHSPIVLSSQIERTCPIIWPFLTVIAWSDSLVIWSSPFSLFMILGSNDNADSTRGSNANSTSSLKVGGVVNTMDSPE